MTVLRIEHGKPYVRLTLDERNLNEEVCAALPSSTTLKSNQPNYSQLNEPDVDPTEVHYVQLSNVDPQPECFHVILMRDCLVTIMNTLKDWDAKKQPFPSPPQPGALACAQYHGDDLWYRVRIQSVSSRKQSTLSFSWCIVQWRQCPSRSWLPSVLPWFRQWRDRPVGMSERMSSDSTVHSLAKCSDQIRRSPAHRWRATGTSETVRDRAVGDEDCREEAKHLPCRSDVQWQVLARMDRGIPEEEPSTYCPIQP